MVDRALVFDYDGVLAEIGKDIPLPWVQGVLRELKRKYRLLIASTRSTGFLVEQVPSADAYIGVNGLEVLAGGYLVYPLRALDERRSRDVEELYERLREPCLRVELKKSLLGRALGLGVGWRRCPGKPADVVAVEEESEKRGLFVFKYQRPFIEVYVAETSKAVGLRVARALLGVSEVYFFGDSESDIEVFGEVEHPVFVRNEYNRHLSPPGVVEVWQQDLPAFLKRLL